jgi:hypothetical protein
MGWNTNIGALLIKVDEGRYREKNWNQMESRTHAEPSW